MATGVLTKFYHANLPSTLGTLYTVPASKFVYADIWLKNNGAGSNTVVIQIDDGTNNLKFVGMDMAAGDERVERNVKLTAGEIFKGSATNAGEVACRIVGVLET